MKKNILLAAGISGMLFCHPFAEAQAEISVRVVDRDTGIVEKPSFLIQTRPMFIFLPDMGFSVAVESQYDMIYYDDLYYILHDGFWYSSSFFNGPWMVVREDRLPLVIRQHRWEEIRRYRDSEYQKHDRSYWEERDQYPGREQVNEIHPRPTFVYLPDMGFSVAIDSPYEMIYYGDLYYLRYYDGYWFRFSFFNDPWVPVPVGRLPFRIRQHRWEEIRRNRDSEYQKHDRKYWEERNHFPGWERRSGQQPHLPPQQPRGSQEVPRLQFQLRVQDAFRRVREQPKPQPSPSSQVQLRVLEAPRQLQQPKTQKELKPREVLQSPFPSRVPEATRQQQQPVFQGQPPKPLESIKPREVLQLPLPSRVADAPRQQPQVVPQVQPIKPLEAVKPREAPQSPFPSRVPEATRQQQQPVYQAQPPVLQQASPSPLPSRVQEFQQRVEEMEKKFRAR